MSYLAWQAMRGSDLIATELHYTAGTALRGQERNITAGDATHRTKLRGQERNDTAGMTWNGISWPISDCHGYWLVVERSAASPFEA